MKAKKKDHPTFQYSWQTGAPFGREDAELVGRELRKLADANEVDDVRALDKRAVFEAIYSDPAHPLRRLYGDFADEAGAARRHWIDLTGKMLSSIRVQVVRLGTHEFEAPRPMFVHVEAHVRETGGSLIRRTRVLTEDALRNDPTFVSAAGLRVRAMMDSLGALEALVSWRRELVPELVELCAGLRRELDGYLAKVNKAAAE
jgi:hypothetical protein